MRLALVVLALACAHPAPVGPPKQSGPEKQAGPPKPPPLDYVLVSTGAWLRTAASDEAPGARGYRLKGAATDERNLERVWVMRAVSVEGDWVQVENLQPDDTKPHCYGGLSA